MKSRDGERWEREVEKEIEKKIKWWWTEMDYKKQQYAKSKEIFSGGR